MRAGGPCATIPEGVASDSAAAARKVAIERLSMAAVTSGNGFAAKLYCSLGATSASFTESTNCS
jgi:hypothetical protein